MTFFENIKQKLFGDSPPLETESFKNTGFAWIPPENLISLYGKENWDKKTLDEKKHIAEEKALEMIIATRCSLEYQLPEPSKTDDPQFFKMIADAYQKLKDQ